MLLQRAGAAICRRRPYDMSAALLEARSLKKHYDDGRIEALRGVDLSIAAGEYIAISGPSGSGKSTLLQLLGGLDSPTSGEIRFESAALRSPAELDAYRSCKVGFIFQAFHLLPTLNAVENVQVAMLAKRKNGQRRAEQAAMLLEEMGLKNRCRHYPNELSAGERQRVAIARALVNGPDLLLADEPTGDLDERNAEAIFELMQRLHRSHQLTSIFATHNLSLARRADRLLCLEHGKLAGAGEARVTRV